jgi:dTDP-4-dehydrorhamnose reductase
MGEFSRNRSFDVRGSARSTKSVEKIFSPELLSHVIPGIDGTDMGLVGALLGRVEPDIVVNCIGVIKQDPSVEDTTHTMALNAEFPHLLAGVCAARGIRLIHVSTDCVFSGKQGRYIESNSPDPVDLYGRSKLLGEVTEPPALTLRTSFIGHELESSRSLVDWFLSQTDVVNGFTRAIYSGLTAMELSHMLTSVVFPREDLTGLYHVASNPISKYELLSEIANEYGWSGKIVPSSDFECDRSLSADSFFLATGYRPPEWPEMIKEMHRTRGQTRL